jgi:WD40 repeat protein
LTGQHYKYWAFISYSHQDRAWAEWLHKSLETYRVPRRLVGSEHWSGSIPRRLAPIFRDRDELPSSAELGSVLNQALRQSRYLIVVCSPQAVASRWVNEEVKYFKSLGRSQYVLPLIIGGEPDASLKPGSGLAECLPPAVRYEVDANGELSQRRAEPIAADARGGKDGRANAKLKLIAGLINVGLDELKQRERQRQFWRRVSAAAAVVALTVLAGLGWRWQQAEKHRALEAQALQTRIAQLYENGRQELLAHNEARAAVYLNEAYKLGVDTPALRFMLARAMRVVDAQVLRVQTGLAVFQIALSPDGNRFFTIGQDLVLRIWDTHAGRQLRQYSLEEDTDDVLARFSAKGKRIWIYTHALSDQSSRLKILDSNNAMLMRELQTGGIFRDAFAEPIDDQDRLVAYLKPDRSIAVEELDSRRNWHLPGQYSMARFCHGQPALITGAEQGEVSLRAYQSGRVLRRFPGLHGAVVALDSSAGCKTLAAGSDQGEVRLWNASDSSVLMTGGHPQAIIDVQLNPSGSRLTSQTRGGVNVWSGRNGALLFAAKFFDPVNVIAATSPEGTLLATISSSRLVMTDPIQGQELYTLDGHLGAARNFNFGVLDTQLASAGSDGSVVLWKLPERLTETFQIDEPAAVAAASTTPVEVQSVFNHRGDAFFVGGSRGAGELYAAKTWRIAPSDREGAISAIAFSLDDHILAIGQRDQKLRLRDAGSGAVLAEWPALGGRVRALSYSPHGDLLATIVQEETLRSRLRQIPDGKDLTHFDIDWPKAQAFSPDGKTYAIGSDGALKLWDVEQRAFRWVTQFSAGETKEGKIAVVAFSPDGKTLLAVQAQTHAYLLNVVDGKVLHTVNIPAAGGLYTAAFSPNGSRITFGDYGKSVFVWQLGSDKVQTLLGHAGEIRSVSFSPDGALLLSAGSDGAVKIWDAEKQELLGTATVHDGPVSWYGAGFNTKGTQALIGGADGTAKILDMKQERRDSGEIAALLSCRTAWRIVGVELIPVQPQVEDCSAK